MLEGVEDIVDGLAQLQAHVRRNPVKADSVRVEQYPIRWENNSVQGLCDLPILENDHAKLDNPRLIPMERV